MVRGSRQKGRLDIARGPHIDERFADRQLFADERERFVDQRQCAGKTAALRFIETRLLGLEIGEVVQFVGEIERRLVDFRP